MTVNFSASDVAHQNRVAPRALSDNASPPVIGRLERAPAAGECAAGRNAHRRPRPHPIALNEMFAARISPLSRRSWAQVNGCRGETDTVERMRRRIECDLFYIDNWSFLLDIKIILTTLFSKRAYANAVQSSSIENKDRMR